MRRGLRDFASAERLAFEPRPNTTATATKALAMTKLQKIIVGAVLAATVGTGIYQARQASYLRKQVQTLHQHQASLTEQIEQLSPLEVDYAEFQRLRAAQARH